MMADIADLQFGIKFTAQVHLTSPTKEMTVCADVAFGFNKTPTKAYANKLIKQAIAQANEAFGADDFRLVELEDIGYANMRDLEWVVKQG